MIVLGIETSCDETGVGIVRDGRDVLANIIASQHELHREYGGVVPEIASRAHVERIIPVLRKALHKAEITPQQIDAVAVGHRPGLIGALLVGVAAAKALAWSLDKPLVGIDHVHAHLYAGLLEQDVILGDVFPALGLAVSGGHTALYSLRSPLEVTRLGSTIDDAIGEAYDKVASMLNLPHPGGPKLDVLARQGDERAFDFPISRLAPDSLDFSFSGLKTAVLYTLRGVPNARREDLGGLADPAGAIDPQLAANIAASFQRVAVRVVMLKLKRALEQAHHRPKSLLIGGGVSANSRLRTELLEWGNEEGLPVHLPRMEYCLDNGAMIAGLAFHRIAQGEADGLELSAVPTTSC